MRPTVVHILLALATITLLGCTSGPEQVETAAQPQATEASKMPKAPWAIIFADASGNRFHFVQPSENAQAEFDYTPVTPEHSSSGIYSGGMAASGELTSTQVAAIWAEVETLRDDVGSHVEQRMMGTGSFLVEVDGARHQFIVRAGPAVERFTQLVTPLRDPD